MDSNKKERHPLDTRVAEALRRRRQIGKVAAEYRNLQQDINPAVPAQTWAAVNDVPDGKCNPESAYDSTGTGECNHCNPQECGSDTVSVFGCKVDFTCNDGFTCNTTNDFVCLDENTCGGNGTFTCSAGHVFYCFDNDDCSGDGFSCKAKNDPACSPSTSPPYTVDDGNGGDFLCGTPGGNSDAFDCDASKFECEAADDFACNGSTDFDCKTDFDCNAADDFDCVSDFECTTSFDCGEDTDFSCEGTFTCLGHYCDL